MQNITLGYALTGSFCTIRNSIEALKKLSEFDIKIKPIMYPPVLPSRMPIPEVKCANTGTPNAPSNTYKIIDTVPRLPPKADSMKNTAKVCIVNGTVVGMLIQEHTEIRTAPNAM